MGNLECEQMEGQQLLHTSPHQANFIIELGIRKNGNGIAMSSYKYKNKSKMYPKTIKSEVINGKSFKEYCESTLPTTVYNNLTVKLGLSAPTVQKYLRTPQTMPLEVLQFFARALDVEPYFLAEWFEAGMDRVTAREYKRINTRSLSIPNGL